MWVWVWMWVRVWVGVVAVVVVDLASDLLSGFARYNVGSFASCTNSRQDFFIRDKTRAYRRDAERVRVQVVTAKLLYLSCFCCFDAPAEVKIRLGGVWTWGAIFTRWEHGTTLGRHATSLGEGSTPLANGPAPHVAYR